MNAYVQILRRGWWLVALTVVMALGAARVLTARQPRLYRATASIVVAPDPSIPEITEVLRTVEALERRSVLATFAELSRSPRVQAAASTQLEWDALRASQYAISATVLPYANILRVSAEGPDAADVAAIAEAVAVATGAEAQRLYPPFRVELLAQATPPQRATLPDPLRNFVVAGVLGLIGGMALAFGYGRLGLAVHTLPSLRPVPAHAAK
jgi:uncharacterized protein involved in exopolysaccharide biosynthesis